MEVYDVPYTQNKKSSLFDFRLEVQMTLSFLLPKIDLILQLLGSLMAGQKLPLRLKNCWKITSRTKKIQPVIRKS